MMHFSIPPVTRGTERQWRHSHRFVGSCLCFSAGIWVSGVRISEVFLDVGVWSSFFLVEFFGCPCPLCILGKYGGHGVAGGECFSRSGCGSKKWRWARRKC